jgi:hypothetical protein
LIVKNYRLLSFDKLTNQNKKEQLENATENWGIQVERVEM